MAIGKASDMVVYQDQAFAGYTETLMQNAELFNGASRGAIILAPKEAIGEYTYRSFVKTISALVSRRDVTSVSSATDTALTMDDEIDVKIHRKVGPIANTLDAWRKIGVEPEMQAFYLGQQLAQAKLEDQLNMGLYAAAPAFYANLGFDATDGTIETTDIISGMNKMGDAMNEIVCWVMHSKVYNDLIAAQYAGAVTNVAHVGVSEGSPVTMNRPVLVTDSAGIYVSGSPDYYYTLGLTRGAIRIADVSALDLFFERISGLENLVIRYQGEYDYTLGLKGFEYDVSNGGANPTSSTLATATNWDQVATSDKATGGFVIKSQ